MEISGHVISHGTTFNVVYRDADSFDALPQQRIRQCYGVCYHTNNIILAYAGSNNSWTLIGGTVESGEALLDTLARELIEEASVKLLKAIPIGYQEVEQPDGPSIFQLRYYCQVEPIGPFESDPAGHITKIEEMPEQEAQSRLKWGQIGHHILERAAEIHRQQK